MPLTEKKIWSEFLDAETAPHLVSAQAFINGLNIRFGSTEDGASGNFENIKGMEAVASLLPEVGDNICIGACADDTDRYIIFWNFNSAGDHGIYLYDILSNTSYVVCLDADITGGLNFSKYSLINGAHVTNGIQYYNDNNNEPRRLNLSAFMAASGASPLPAAYPVVFPIDETEITLIKKPATYPPSITKKYDAAFINNFISKNSFQFAVRYVYFDGEEAVLSGWSRSSLFNFVTQNENYIDVRLDVTEVVPQTVRLVQLIVRNGETDKGVIVKQWDRKVATELVLIDLQNLAYNFYGNVTGATISDASMVRPFHSVPILAGTQAAGKDRLMLADITEGYDTPGKTSLTLSLPTPIAPGFTTIVGKPIAIIRHDNHRDYPGSVEEYAYGGYYVYLTEVPLQGWYAITASEILDITSHTPVVLTYVLTGSLAFADLTWRGADLAAVAWATARPGTFRLNGSPAYYTASVTTITGFAVVTYPLMLPQSTHRAGVTFYDRYLRKCGIVEGAATISIPPRNFGLTTGYTSLDWALSNADAVNEIPDWAYYYSVDRVLNQATRYFVAAYDEATRYATRNNITGLLEYDLLTYSAQAVAIAIDTAALLRAGLGYTLNEGDECILIRDDNTVYNLPVIGQDGQYILLKPVDIGTLNTLPATTRKFVYRVYTPYKTSEQEPFFQMGELYTVGSPGTGGRGYTTVVGSFRADAIAITRVYNGTTYFAEAMNPNDLYYARWETDAGRANIITKLGQVRKKTGLAFSNVYLPGTQTNGLSAFEALNKEILPAEMGTIRKLMLAAKVQAEGNVMLAIGENETASIYLGEVELFDQKGSSFLAKSSGFIGQVNILQGSYGTQNPESVVHHGGQVAWIDVKSYSAVRYSNNGLFPISDFNMKRAFQLFCKKFETLSIANLEALGSRPFIFGGADDYHNEFLWAIPRTEEEPPKGYLDYSIAYEYEDLYAFNFILSQYVLDVIHYRAYSAHLVYLPAAAIPGWYLVDTTQTIGPDVLALPAHLPIIVAPDSGVTLTFLATDTAALLEYMLTLNIIDSGGFGATEPVTVDYTNVLVGEIALEVEGINIAYPYDIYDGRAKVLVFRITESKWSAPHGYEPEMFAGAGSHLFCFKAGVLFENNKTTDYNKFFGVDGKSQIMFVARTEDGPSKIKTELALAVEGNQKPTFVHFRTETPNVQSSDLVASNFKTKEGIFYAPVLRDRLSPNKPGGPLQKLLKGDRMRGPWIYIMAEWDTRTLLQLKFINASHRVSAGHEFV